MDEPFPGLRHELAVDPRNQGSEQAIADLVRFLNAVTDIAVLANHCQDDLEPVVDLLLGQGIDAEHIDVNAGLAGADGDEPEGDEPGLLGLVSSLRFLGNADGDTVGQLARAS
jgi:hypothetical protein